MQRGVYVSGKVMLDDGTPPPESVVIERVCNGSMRPEGYTDSKGRFSFQLGQNGAVMADASSDRMDDARFGMGSSSSSNSRTSSGGFSQANGPNLMGCELRAALPGFRSDTVNLYGKRALDNPDVGTIVLHRLGKVDGFTFSGTSAYAPKDAKKAFDKGKDLSKKHKWEDAEKEFMRAVDIYPKYAAGWYELGLAYQQQEKIKEAKEAYVESLKADGKFVSPYAQLTRLASFEGKWQDAADYSDKLLKLNPYFSADTYFYNSVAYFNLKKLDVAEERANEALKMDTQHHNPKINQLLAVILERKQDYSGAAENLRSYLKFAPEAKDADKVKQQLAEVEKLVGAKATPSEAQEPQQPQ
jgi:Flp pilus assembly protein TadD